MTRVDLVVELEVAASALLQAGQVVAAERARRAAETARDDIERVAESVRELRRPRPPEELVDALQDRPFPTSGRLLSASPVIRESAHETFHYRARLAGFDEPTEEQRKAAQFCVDFDLASKGGK